MTFKIIFGISTCWGFSWCIVAWANINTECFCTTIDALKVELFQNNYRRFKWIKLLVLSNGTHQFWPMKTQRSTGRWWKESPLVRTPRGRHDMRVSLHGGRAQVCNARDQDGSTKTIQINLGNFMLVLYGDWLDFKTCQIFSQAPVLFKVFLQCQYVTHNV